MTERERLIELLKQEPSRHSEDIADYLLKNGVVVLPSITIKALEKEIAKKVKIGQSSKVKAFDGEDKVLTYKCYPCPNCRKWIVANENHKYCEWCGQKLDWSECE